MMTKFLKKLTISDKGKVKVQEFNNNDKIDKSKFTETKNRVGNLQLETDVYVTYKDDYDNIIEENNNLRNEVNQLKQEKNKLSKSLKEVSQEYYTKLDENREKYQNKLDTIDNDTQKKIDAIEDEYNQKFDKFKQDHQENLARLEKENADLVNENTTLRDKISAIEKQHVQELREHDNSNSEKLLQSERDHNKEVNDVKEKYQKVLDDARGNFLKNGLNITRRIDSSLLEIEDIPVRKAIFKDHKKKAREIRENELKDIERSIEHTYEITSIEKLLLDE